MKIVLLLLTTLITSLPLYTMEAPGAIETDQSLVEAAQSEPISTLQQLALEKIAQLPMAKLLPNIRLILAGQQADLAYLVLQNRQKTVADKQTLLNALAALNPSECVMLGLSVLLTNETTANKNILLNTLHSKIPATSNNYDFIRTLQIFINRASESLNNGINTTFTPVTLSGMPIAVLAQQSSTLLIDAIRAQNVVAVTVLLNNGADPNLSPFDDQELKPLRLVLDSQTLTQDQKNIVDMLLQAGASVEFGETVQENAFYIAAERQDQELMDLLKENADINKLFKHPAHTTPVTILDRVETIAQSNPEFYNPIVQFLQANGAQRSADLPAPMATETQ